MTRAAALLICLAIVCLVFALSREDSPDPVYVEASAKTAQTSSTTVLSDAAVPSLNESFGALVEAMKPKPRPKARTAPKPRTQTTVRAASVIGSTIAGYPCGGGDYPPCYAIARESGGDFHAYNPTGCGGRSCGGRAQWDPVTWMPGCTVAAYNAGGCTPYQGYRQAQNAPPEVQMQREREVWNHGAGCGHWAACG